MSWNISYGITALWKINNCIFTCVDRVALFVNKKTQNDYRQCVSSTLCSGVVDAHKIGCISTTSLMCTCVNKFDYRVSTNILDHVR